VEDIQRGEVMPFVGAGVSVGAGLPGWADLVRPLAQSIGDRWPINEADLTVDHFTSATNRYVTQRGLHPLLAYLREKLDTTHLNPTRVHQVISSLPTNTVCTTNYDDLMEKALDRAGRKLCLIVEDSELPFWREDGANLIKLCGDLKRPESIVITKSDYSVYFSAHRRLAERLRGLLESKTAIFIGYSLRDPFFNQIWDCIGLDFGRIRRWGYAVLFAPSPLEVEELRQRSIHVIDLGPTGPDQTAALANWLEDLMAAVNVPWRSIGPSPNPDTKRDHAPSIGPIHLGTGNRWAVLAGADAYEDALNYGRLQVCVNDVRAVRDRLTAAGYSVDRVRLITDEMQELPTRDNILVALQAIANAAEPDDLLLFYYSGHGDEADNESYLVARSGRRLVLRDTAVSIVRVKEILSSSRARAKVIIIDACHSGADIRGKGPRRMSEGFIRRVFDQAEGFAVLASCKQGQLSYEWRAKERSVFTHFLLEALDGIADRDCKGFVTVQDVNRHVTNGVKLWASQNNVDQTPTLQSAVAGDIILCTSQIMASDVG
jgi:hypothetical protein